jgi:hypothetical protein
MPDHESGLSSGNQNFWRLVAKHHPPAIELLQRQMQIEAKGILVVLLVLIDLIRDLLS